MSSHLYTTKKIIKWSYPSALFSLGVTSLLFLVALSFQILPTAQAKSPSDCKVLQVIFARGSGSVLNDTMARSFRTAILDRINTTNVSTGAYELGSGWPDYAHPDTLYPAIAISGDHSSRMVGLSTKMSNGENPAYRTSIDRGVFELYEFLTETNRKCPETQYIIGGYSQGAHVVGDTLPYLSYSTRQQIVFVALFGDPKLHLPEGEGFYAPACRGEQYSAWRRSVPNCETDNGTLGARKPYVPTDFQNKAGTWCNGE